MIVEGTSRTTWGLTQAIGPPGGRDAPSRRILIGLHSGLCRLNGDLVPSNGKVPASGFSPFGLLYYRKGTTMPMAAGPCHQRAWLRPPAYSPRPGRHRPAQWAIHPSAQRVHSAGRGCESLLRRQGGAMVASHRPSMRSGSRWKEGGQSDNMAKSDKERRRGAMRLAGCSSLPSAPNNKQNMLTSPGESAVGRQESLHVTAKDSMRASSWGAIWMTGPANEGNKGPGRSRSSAAGGTEISPFRCL